MENRRVRLRFAPSPTGGLHMGGVRTALFSYLFAKKHNGDFILRIEDTDQTRYVKGAEEYIIESLKWCGIEPNEGVGFGDGPHAPYRQSERKELGIYKKYADQLIASGHAYFAFDTAEELDAMRKRLEAAKVVAPQYNSVSRQNMRNSLTLSEDEVKKLMEAGTPYVIRLKVPRNEEIRFHDIIRGWVVVNSTQVDDKVLLKSDGMPTYHLAHIVDDIEMKVSHAVRGEEWLPSAPSHVLIYRYLGMEDKMPLLAHLPLILKPDGNGKLSKRDKSGIPMFPLDWYDERTGEKYVGYRETGFFPEAFINMLAMLGWNPGTTQEIFSLDELIQAFSFERVNKSGAKFDPEKTKWFNQQYLRKKSDVELAELFMPILNEKLSTLTTISQQPTAAFVEGVCRLVKEKAHFVSEFWTGGSYFFIAPTAYDADVIKKRWNEQSAGFIKEVTEAFKNLNTFTAAETEATFKATAEKSGIGAGQVMQLFRVCLSGVGGGPMLFEMVELLGKDELGPSIVLFIGVALAYTAVGGIKAVIWTDAAQFVLFLAGGLATLGLVASAFPGGWGEVMRMAATEGKLHWLNPGFALAKPFNIWMGVIGGAVMALSTHGAEQLIVQRVLACRSVADGRKALVLSAVLILPLFLIFLLVGVSLWAWYQTHTRGIPIPEVRPGIKANDFVYPIFMLTGAPTILRGFLIVAILSAAMSSVSSALTSLASVSTMDLLKPLLPGRSESFFLRLSKASTVVWAVLLAGVAFLSREVEFVLNTAFSLRGLTSGALLGGLILCLYGKRGSPVPVMTGMGASFAVMVLLSFKLGDAIFWPWYTLIGTVVCLATAMVTSSVIPQKSA